MFSFKCLNNVIYLWIILNVSVCFGFYLPGLAPVNYCKESESSSQCKSDITLYVNRLNTEESVIPYEYHHFDFCKIDERNSPVENLGQVVFGERIRPGPYKIEFMNDVTCAKVCTQTYRKNDPDSEKRLDTLKKGMSLNYQHHWIVDNMPVTWCYPLENSKKYCSIGFPMGCFLRPHSESYDGCPISSRYSKPGFYYPFNHVTLTITYHSGQSEEWGVGFGANGGRIISVKVEPLSINHRDPNKPDCSSNAEPLAIPSKLEEDVNITYTYSVRFVQDNTVKWSIVQIILNRITSSNSYNITPY